LIGSYEIDAISCAAAALAPTACVAIAFEAADDRRASVPTDFDPEHTKGQCGLDEYVAGVSLSQGHIHGLLCCALP
jgi:hypothetical protein